MNSRSYHAEEQEFKLPLRQWLLKKIEHGNFDGLEWVDKSKGLFKIPWTAKHHPNWERHYEIFREWAKHKDKYDENNPPDEKKLKGNFRCALHKSIDFEEIKKDSLMDQQTGNFKTYRVLKPDEVKEKNKRRKHSHDCKNVKTSPPSSYSPLAFPSEQNVHGNGYSHIQQMSHNGIQPHQAFASSPGGNQMKVEHQPQHTQHQQQVRSPTTYHDMSNSTPSPGFTTTSSHQPVGHSGFLQRSLHDVVAQHQQNHVQHPQEQQLTHHQLHHQPQQLRNPELQQEQQLTRDELPPPPYSTFPLHSMSDQSGEFSIGHISESELIFSPTNPAECRDISMTLSPSENFTCSDESSSFRSFLNNFDIKSEDMFKYEVSVLYDGILQHTEVFNLRDGVRLFYGDVQIQQAIIEAFNVDTADIHARAVNLPLYHGDKAPVKQILSRCDQGFTLKCDHEASLWANRMSQTVLFYFDAAKDPGQATKMERYKPVQLFSYRQFVRSLITSLQAGATRSLSSEVKLYAGTKPRTPGQNSLVNVCVESLAAKTILQNTLGEQSFLAFSQQNSIDELLRMIGDPNELLRP